MFYTLLSKVNAIKESKYGFLITFFIGSVIYLCIHHYLHTYNKIDLLDKYKTYLYFVMLADLGLAYYLLEQHNKKKLNNKYTNEQREEIENDYQQLKRAQMMYQYATNNNNNMNNINNTDNVNNTNVNKNNLMKHKQKHYEISESTNTENTQISNNEEINKKDTKMNRETQSHKSDLSHKHNKLKQNKIYTNKKKKQDNDSIKSDKSTQSNKKPNRSKQNNKTNETNETNEMNELNENENKNNINELNQEPDTEIPVFTRE